MKLIPVALSLAAWTLAAPAVTLDAIYSKMDANAASFSGMTAKMTRLDYTAIIKDTTKESGIVAMRKAKGGGGRVAMKIDFTDPEKKSFSYRDKKVELYFPKINTVQIFETGKFDNALTQGLLIGFGSTAAELKSSYEIKLAGDHLELTPKEILVREHIKRIELWLDSGDGYPRQVKIHKPSGDYTLISYSEIRMMPGLTEDQVRLQLPKNVKRENMK